ncbi:IQ domain-containing protein K-like [Pectinophora gossypiella]|uniref:IQ domain-containing protein K-like n=1 Tax=Pectinophora gossypiella TaxID=13191 RepID=UPI00214F45D5|nr:IQ domain-containing protein K-like [Pectinophora gossypiella]
MAAKGKLAKAKQENKAANEMAETLAAFTLPDSLPCSEVSFPVLVQRATKANWKTILKESEQRFMEIEEFVENKKEPIPLSPFQKTECDYVKNEVFTQLLPALEDTLNKAKMWNVFYDQRCFFNGIDWIVQELWNNNPRYPIRKDSNLHVFNMPWVRKYLEEHPRPLYPKSWLWPEEYAATLIQKTLRQYFVQREEEVQEMRDFWRKLEVERTAPDINTNPYLAKKFASERNISSSGKTH